MLSLYIRHRLLSVHEVVAAVLARHAPNQAEKFIQEVFWRTYWKGWLQMRPKVWRDFVVERNAGLARAQAETESGRTFFAPSARR